MKYIISALAILTFSIQYTLAQTNKGGLPISFTNYNTSQILINKLTLTPPDKSQEKSINSSPSNFEYDGKTIKSDIEIYQSATKTTLNDGSKIWQLEIEIPKAKALVLYYDRFIIPNNANLFIYNPDKTQILGAYTQDNNTGYSAFATEMITGDKLIIEYFEPKDVSGANIHINEIGYLFNYTDIAPEKSNTFGTSGACNVNINCSPEGDNWQNHKTGVVRMLTKTGNDLQWCTGSLINNTEYDCTPYLISANHCRQGGSLFSPTNSSSEDYKQWIFYFDYESKACDNPTSEPKSTTRVGAKYISSSKNQNINDILDNNPTESDFLLIRLFNDITDIKQVYYAGWDRTGNNPLSAVGIHHPEADIKKISSSSSIVSEEKQPISIKKGASWGVIWKETPNGHGVTAHGSSGSPLYNEKGLIVGTLSSGASECSPNLLKATDSYGKFNYHWDLTGDSAHQRLKDWLDPNNQEYLFIEGKKCNSTPIINDFWADKTLIKEGENIIFHNFSCAPATAIFEWKIQGATNPNVTARETDATYLKKGTYNVTLTISNNGFTHTVTKENYITVQDNTAIEQIDINDFNVYPNPCRESLYIESNKEVITSIELYNNMGSLIKCEKINQSKNHVFETSHSIPGIYLIKINTTKGSIFKRISIL